MFQVEYSSQALKFFKKIDRILAKRLLKKIEDLAVNPHPQESRWLKVTRRRYSG